MGRTGELSGFSHTQLFPSLCETQGILRGSHDVMMSLGREGAFMWCHPPSEGLPPTRPSLSSGFSEREMDYFSLACGS